RQAPAVARVEQETARGTAGVLAYVALGAPGRCAASDDVVTLTVRAADGDERHGPFLAKEAMKTRPSVTAIAVHLHFCNTTKSRHSCRARTAFVGLAQSRSLPRGGRHEKKDAVRCWSPSGTERLGTATADTQPAEQQSSGPICRDGSFATRSRRSRGTSA